MVALKTLPSVEDQGALSRLLFFWFWGVLRAGYKGRLIFEQLPPTAAHDSPTRLYAHFERLWSDEADRGARKHAKSARGSVQSAAARPGSEDVRLLRVMLMVIGRDMLAWAFALSVVQMSLNALTPFLSKWLLESLADPEQTDDRRREQVYYAMGFVLLPLIASSCQARVMYASRRASQHLFTVFTQAIYNKALRLSSAARNESSSGQIVNLMSVDAGSSMERAVLMIYPLFLAPPLIGVLLYLLYQELGVAAYAGLACIVVAMPVNVLIFGSIMRVYQRIITVTDERVKLVNEAVGAVRILKMYAWELPFVRKIAAVRERELVLLRKHGLLYGIGLNAVFLQLPFLIQFAAFTYYYLEGNTFLPWIIFTAIQLLQVLQQALTQLPSAIVTLTQAVVAARRIKTFLLLPELTLGPDDVVLLQDEDDEERNAAALGLQRGEMRVEAGSFRWDLLDTSALERRKRGRRSRKTEAPPVVEDGGEEQHEAKHGTGPVLHNIQLHLRPGQRCAVVGRVGSGKSSLLAALVGELETSGGQLAVFGSVAYAPQQPWIVSETVRNNILFGRAWDQRRYAQVLEACCLESDLELFPNGDEQFVGERGVSLSGGQKARIALARAVYADASIVLLDDVLAAVDAHVGQAIFEGCIMGPLLRGKTLVWVTNQVERARFLDSVVVLDGGAIKAQGRYATLAAAGELDIDEDAAERARQHRQSTLADDATIVTAENFGDEEESGDRRASAVMEADFEIVAAAAGAGGSDAQFPTERMASALSEASGGGGGTKQKSLYAEEEEAVGTLKFAVLRYYIVSVGVCLFLAAYGTYWVYLFTPVTMQYILTWWTDEVLCELQQVTDCDTSLGADGWYTVYAAVLGTGMFLVLVAGVFIALARVSSSRVIHEQLLRSTFDAGITDYFDVQPMGRILNRFSKDVSTMDIPLNQMLMFGFATLGFTAAAFVGIVLGTNGIFAAMIPPILILYVIVYRFTRSTSIQLQRLEATSRSPIFSNFAELLNGLRTVRAFRQQQRFLLQNRVAVERNLRAYFPVRVVLPAWLMMTVNLLGVLISASVCALLLGTDLVGASQAGLALTYALAITQALNATTMVNTEVEVMFNSVERIKKSIDDVQPEDPLRGARQHKGRGPDADGDSAVSSGTDSVARGAGRAAAGDGRGKPLVPKKKKAAGATTSESALAREEPWEAEAADRAGADADWPAQGRIEFRDLVVGYRDGPDVLHGVSMVLEPGAKIGVCGRTGSGKTTLTAALLRVVEARGGCVLIDGVDIASLPLRTLRSRVAIIPQEPTCFTGSLRFNLDPFGEFTDDRLRECLRQVQLDKFAEDLDMQVAENGENISVGQRQMVSFARAMLRDTRVLVMDEATANVDDSTDKLLQVMVRTVFAERTSITIAHRLRTILQSTKVAVLDNGVVAEFATPQELLADPRTAFAKMVAAEKGESPSPRNDT